MIIHLKESVSSEASISLHEVKEKQEHSDQLGSDDKQKANYSETQLAKLKEENKRLQVQLQRTQVDHSRAG